MSDYGKGKLLKWEDNLSLVHADCREYFFQMKTSNAGLDFKTVVTDIPYGEASDRKRGGGREKYKGQLREVGKGGENARTIPDDEIVRWLLESGADSYYVFCSTEQAGTLRRDFQDAGLSTRTGVWIKTNPSPANGQYLWENAVEVLVFARKSKAFFHEDYHCKPLVWNVPVVHHASRFVRTQKPLTIIADMIRASTPPGGAVLDPFCGSGGTLMVARDLNHPAVGIEKDKERAKKALERLW